MQIYRSLIAFCLCATLCHAQAPNTDQALLSQARAKYDTPFDRNLQSFDCTVDFSWKGHWAETTRVGDEGTDEEFEKVFQPIQNRVTVTRQNVKVYSGLTDDDIGKLPHGGMAEFLLEHAVQRSLNNWLTASVNTLLPAPDAPVHFEKSSSGKKISLKMQNFDVEMYLTPDMRLQSATAKGSRSDHFETVFTPGQHGFLLSSWTMTEDGNPDPGHRLIFHYTYQTVDGVELPEHVAVIRESHHEVWRYKLSGCTVKTSR